MQASSSGAAAASVRISDASAPPALTTTEIIGLIEGWLRNAPALTFKRVKSDARNLGVIVTPRHYSAAKKSLGITGAAPREAAQRPAQPRGHRMNGAENTPKTPLMNFVIEFLRGRPDATFQDVKQAGAAANFQVAPINYGNARRALGIAPMAKPASGRGRRARAAQPSQSTDAAPSTAPAPRGRRGRKRKLDFGNLSNLVQELQDVVAERDRILAALDQIAAIIRNV